MHSVDKLVNYVRYINVSIYAHTKIDVSVFVDGVILYQSDSIVMIKTLKNTIKREKPNSKMSIDAFKEDNYLIFW